ncbi:isochorismatase family protein [Gynuella sunshinyii]|uniref:isochorismatase n=1 Tax=Gynuella sunshinyii YC6258 TaxID=1445510 RepID=A0A0C5V5U2_9GAMM|nr:isochorismatase family protein [Gynuella sunshinyii]AJQ94805.1 isochorismate hydrolase [Gynuella sunshinyii YC6258]
MSIPSLTDYSMPTTESLPANKVNWSLEPAKAVLLIHDMQDYFLKFYPHDSRLIRQLIENIDTLKTFCRQHEIPVVYTAQPDNQSPRDRALLNDMWGAGVNDHAGLKKICAALTPDSHDTVLVKWRYSAFQRSILENMMKELGRDQLIICGIYGHIGCMITAVDAFMRDIKPFMVADAIADFSEQDHRMALNYVATRAGTVISTTAIVESGEKRSQLTLAQLKAQLLSAIDENEDDFDADENLVDYGLDSVQMMSMVNDWRKQGIEINFAELAKNPSLNAWWKLIGEKQAG